MLLPWHSSRAEKSERSTRGDEIWAAGGVQFRLAPSPLLLVHLGIESGAVALPLVGTPKRHVSRYLAAFSLLPTFARDQLPFDRSERETTAIELAYQAVGVGLALGGVVAACYYAQT